LIYFENETSVPVTLRPSKLYIYSCVSVGDLCKSGRCGEWLCVCEKCSNVNLQARSFVSKTCGV